MVHKKINFYISIYKKQILLLIFVSFFLCFPSLLLMCNFFFPNFCSVNSYCCCSFAAVGAALRQVLVAVVVVVVLLFSFDSVRITACLQQTHK